MKSKQPTLNSIIILGKFSDGKVRQFICNENQQITVIVNLRASSEDGILHVIDSSIEGIDWEEGVTNLDKKLKQKKF